MRQSQRAILRSGLSAAAGLVALAVLPRLAPKPPPVTRNYPLGPIVGLLADAGDSRIVLRLEELVLVRDEQETEFRDVAEAARTFLALVPECPCGGGRVHVRTDGFRCPAGCFFDIRGGYLSGPSLRGLDRYPLTVRTGTHPPLPSLFADLERRLPGPPRPRP